MRRFLILSVLFAGSTFVAPMAVSAEDHYKRYYDRNGRDYHTWNPQEDRAYRFYLGEQHREYVDFGKVKADRQREYFVWRHNHPDSALFKVEIR